jgi:hypothetical protein
MDNDNTMVNLQLSVNELNLILASLGKQPFEIVNGLVNKLVADAHVQIKNQNSESPAEFETQQAA